MFLKLYRTQSGSTAVTGKLYVDNVAFCDTLEPAIAPLYGAPGCIAPGFYPVRLTMSPRFGEVLPLIDRVVGRSGIRIHPGNTAADTVGCILVGEREGERLLNSKRAFMHLRARMQRAVKSKEEIWIEIVDATDLVKQQNLCYDLATLYHYEPIMAKLVIHEQEE